MTRMMRSISPRSVVHRLFAVALLLSCISTSGCATNQQTGALVGMVAGAALGVTAAVLTGNADAGVAVGALVGAGLGALIGGAIGADLDEKEKMQAAAAAQTAADAPTGSQVKWTSETHPEIHGYAEPTTPEEYNAGTVCKNIHQVVFTSSGERSQDAKLCRKNGQWLPA
jgi:surface antigen